MIEKNWLAETNDVVPIRQMTERGIELFRVYLLNAKAGDISLLPDELLYDDSHSRILDRRVTVEAGVFETTLDMASYLDARIKLLRLPGKYYDAGLWAWLTAFYLDSVCPPDAVGRRKVGEIDRYIPPANRNFRDVTVHLLAPSVRALSVHGFERTKLVLYTEPFKRSEFQREILQIQELAMNPSIFEALNRLYWDDDKQRPKPGASTKGKPGTLRRFVALMNQFNRTFDLFAMSGEQIIKLLPKEEFGRWLKQG